ncbi:MAG: DUF4178 domain-containing protein [Candidatus Thiodiazotropha sp.]
MLKTLSSLIKSFKKQDAPEELTSPEQLSKGDMLRFADGFSMPEDLRGETFQVQKVATYFYTDTGSPQFVIKSGDRKPLYLSIEDFDGEELIVISRKLKNKEVESLFGWDRLRAAMKDEDSREITVTEQDSSDSWLATTYSRRVFGAEGHYFEKDIRHNDGIPPGGETFRYFEYYTADENKSLEIEVWEGDEIEVCLGLVRPMTDVVELWRRS